jgi:GntR family transcriptional regulator, transcriptional repressor for pyruvate dehydrogenase complex
VALAPVSRRSVIDDVYDQLVGEIVSGALPSGQPLPAERRLAEILGVSRPAVREALQRLAQSGLVDVRQGGGTTVMAFQEHAGPDLLPHLLVRDGMFDAGVARAIVEVRAMVGPGAARLASERRPAHLADALDDLAGQLADADGPVERQRVALQWWDLLVDGTGNIALRLMFNTLRRAYEPALEALAIVLDAEVSQVDGYRAVAQAIRDQQPSRAEATVRALLRPGTEAVLTALAAIEQATSDPEEETSDVDDPQH